MAALAIGEWTRGPAIGRGSSATVSLAVDRRTGAVFAVKSVVARDAGELLLREQSILQSLSASPHVVRCLGASGSGRDLFLEYASGGSLADEIRRRGGERCSERVIRSRARDVLRGLAHVHAAGVAHCDVKPRNVLLVGADGRAVLADFGCARRVVGSGSEGGDAGDSKQPRGIIGGTPAFMAPEAARGEAQGAAADVWAVGCTVVEMATGRAPWWPRFADPMAALRHVAVSGEAPECPRWMSDDARDFLARCFRPDPAERWTAEQLLRHPFVMAASESSNSVVPPIVSEKEPPFVSPKSVLDQDALWWDDDDDESTSSCSRLTAGATATHRVRELAVGNVPDWTWDANWITVHGDDDARSTELEAGNTTTTITSRSLDLSGRPTAATAEEEEEAVSSTTAPPPDQNQHGRTSSAGDSYRYGDAIIVTAAAVGQSPPMVTAAAAAAFRGGGNHVVTDSSSNCNDRAVTSNELIDCFTFIGDVVAFRCLVLSYSTFLAAGPAHVSFACTVYCTVVVLLLEATFFNFLAIESKSSGERSCAARDWQLGRWSLGLAGRTYEPY